MPTAPELPIVLPNLVVSPRYLVNSGIASSARGIYNYAQNPKRHSAGLHRFFFETMTKSLIKKIARFDELGPEAYDLELKQERAAREAADKAKARQRKEEERQRQLQQTQQLLPIARDSVLYQYDQYAKAKAMYEGLYAKKDILRTGVCGNKRKTPDDPMTRTYTYHEVRPATLEKARLAVQEAETAYLNRMNYDWWWNIHKAVVAGAPLSQLGPCQEAMWRQKRGRMLWALARKKVVIALILGWWGLAPYHEGGKQYQLAKDSFESAL